MGFFGNGYDKFGYDSIDESTMAMPSYNNCYSNISDMYEVACQLEIDGNDLIHEMEMNILMNEHNYFVEHGRAVQYSDGYGYLTEEGNSVWRFIQKAWETLMKYLDQCVSWVIDKCKEYILYFKQIWARNVSLKDGIKGFATTVPKAIDDIKDVFDSNKDKFKSALSNCYISSQDKVIWKDVYPQITDGGKIVTSDITDAIKKAAAVAENEESMDDIKKAIIKELKLEPIYGEDKAETTDEKKISLSDTDEGWTEENLNNILASAETLKSYLKNVQAKGENMYKLLQKDFSDSLKKVFDFIRDRKSELRDKRISDREGASDDNETFNMLKRKIKAYNICASYIMKSFSKKINICVKIVNTVVKCLGNIKSIATEIKNDQKSKKTSGSDQEGKKSFSYRGGYQTIF